MTLLRGHFAMTLICAGTADVGRGGGRARRAGRRIPRRQRAARCRRNGRRPGRARATGHRARRGPAGHRGPADRASSPTAGGNITDLTTRLSGELYVLVAEAELPPETADRAARSARRPWPRSRAELGVDGHPAAGGDATTCELIPCLTLPRGRVRGRAGARRRCCPGPALRSTRPTPGRAAVCRPGRHDGGVARLRRARRAADRGGRAGVLRRRAQATPRPVPATDCSCWSTPRWSRPAATSGPGRAACPYPT